MENLVSHNPMSSEPGWTPLYTFLEDQEYLSGSDQIKIFEQLFKIIKLMHERQFVHGDLRSPNLMIKVTGTAPEIAPDDSQLPQIMVVDFDWAGRAGQVHYPISRNVTSPWPGKAGGVISLDDDWILVKNWWSEKFPQFDFSTYALPSPSSV
jgi:serine/threonine protein kinase